MTRPLTLPEAAALFAAHGVKFDASYYHNVIRRRPTHPLYHCRLARGMYDGRMIADFLARRHELDGRRTRYQKSPAE